MASSLLNLTLLLLVASGSLGLLLGALELELVGLPARRLQARRREFLASEAKLLMAIGRQIEQAQKIAEGAVSIGTSIVRGMHSGIAAIPFSILEQIPTTRTTARQVRVSHDLISNAVYGGIQLINSEIHSGLRGVLNPEARKNTEQLSAKENKTSGKKWGRTRSNP